MVKRFGGWLRFGILLSMLWAAGAGIYQRHSDLESAARISTIVYMNCNQPTSRGGQADSQNCEEAASRARNMWLEGSWTMVTILVVAPLILAWLSIFLIVRGFRSLTRGERS